MTDNPRLPLYFLLISLSWAVRAEVTLDGTLGQVGAIPLNNNTYAIDSSVGKIVGSNLFHSFDRFNLETNTGAHFTDSTLSPIANVISRVTGGEPSSIDGTIRSSIPNADFYLINPAGMVFGPHAQLNVPASFHASTASTMTFQDGGHFDAANPSNDVLTSAPPQAFGFLESASGVKAGIESHGSFLGVNGGESLDISANKINLDNSAIVYAPGGEIRLVAMQGEGEVGLQRNTDGALPLPVQTPTPSQAGEISVTGNSQFDYGGLATSGNGGGRIALWGGNLSFQDGVIKAVNFGAKDANASQGIDINSTSLSLNDFWIGTGTSAQGRGGNIKVDSTNMIELYNGAQIYNDSIGTGASGGIAVKTGSLKIDRQDSFYQTGILSRTDGTGNAGNILVEATGNMEIAKGGSIFSGTMGDGNAAEITVKAANLNIDRRDTLFPTGIISVTEKTGTGRAGAVHVETSNTLVLDHGAWISSATENGSDSSIVTIDTNSLKIQGRDVYGRGSAVATTADETSSGRAGNIYVNARSNVELLDGGVVASYTYGSGKSGDLAVKANALTIDGSLTGIASTSDPVSSGSSGNVIVESNDYVEIKNGGFIHTATASTGSAGNVSVTTDRLTIEQLGKVNNELTGIYSNSVGDFSGHGGDVNVTAHDNVSITGGEISADTYGSGNAGNIFLNSNSLHVDGQNHLLGGIDSSSFGSGAAGNIWVTANSILLSRAGYISSITTRSGRAGLIDMRVKQLSLIEGGEISTSSLGTADAGNVFIRGIDRTSAANEVFISGVSDNLPILLPDGRFVKGEFSGIYLNTTGSGNGGSLEMNADHLAISDGGVISAIAAFGSTIDTQGGSIDIHAQNVDLSGGALISASTSGIGKAGSVKVIADDSITIGGRFDRIRHAGVTNLRFSDRSGISSGATYDLDPNASGLGVGGQVTVSARFLNLFDGAEISAVNKGSDEAGTIDITATDTLTLKQGSAITVESAQGNAGDINVSAGRLIYLLDSSMTTSAAGGFGNGGNISIDPTFVVLNNSDIIANAVQGKGGNIDIITDFFLPSVESIVSASSTFGLQGTVSIQSQYSNIAGSIGVLPGSLLDVSNLLNDDCAAAAVNASSFTIGGRGGLPLSPDSFWFQGLQSMQCGVGL